jgi:glycosyltransferase involved in cell wall biosynthesis
VARFNAVADRGNLDFEVWFSEVRQADRTWDVDESAWRFPARYIPLRSLFGLRLRVPVPELAQTRPDLFITEYDRLNLAAGALAARVTAARLAFRTLPNFDATSHRTWWREASKHLLFRSVDGVKVPGPGGAGLAARYGVPTDRASVVTQSIDVKHYARAMNMSDERRCLCREKLGLGGCVFLFVGRLVPEKGLDVLLAAFRRLAAVEERADVSLLIVGDGFEEDRYHAVAADLPRVHFAGFVQPAELPDWYGLADCLVLPTYGDSNGLVVEEAFAAGLPVISSDSAGDIRLRLPEGVAGFIFPAGDATALTHCMRRIAERELCPAQVRTAAKQLVSIRTDDRYAADFEQFVAHILQLPRRRSSAALVTGFLGRLLVLSTRLLRWAPVAAFGPCSNHVRAKLCPRAEPASRGNQSRPV